MIHQQHSVHPIPRNQLPRDSAANAKRMAHSQISTRLPQPGIVAGQQQGQPRSLAIGIQQSSAPGVMVPVQQTSAQQNAVQQQVSSMQTAGSSDSDTSGLRIQQATTASPASPSHSSTSQVSPSNNESSTAPVTTDEQQQSNPTTQVNNLANTKEKTPMCLINELARLNKVTHQYRLTSELGPAHKKCFTVTLKLGDEEYTAEGPSIKKAQHSAAADALVRTRYEHPPPKTQRILRVRKVNITPTVELNALAMKRGEPTSYTFLEPMPPPNYFRGMSYQREQRGMLQRFHYNKPMYGTAMFFVSLRVGDREYTGQGRTAQAARHDAASKALQEIRQLPMPEGTIVTPSTVTTNGQDSSPGESQEQGTDLKSPISLVHEMALKRNMPVTFEVIKEKGPPHMRTFLTSCRVGEIMSTEGEGNSKKTSKKRAAEQMLEVLKKLPPVSPPVLVPSQRMKRKPTAVKKKTRNLIKEQKVKQEYTDDINPISRLIQIQQAKKEREPEYTLIEERGLPRRKEFVMEVTVGQHSCTGSGLNKKLAKRAAAEALLQLLGYSQPGEASASPATGKYGADPGNVSQPSGSGDKTRKVTFLDDTESKDGSAVSSAGQPGGSGGRQLVPGLLLMTPQDNTNASGFPKAKGGRVKAASSGSTRQTAAVIAKELLSCGSSPTAEALVAAGQIQNTHSPITSATHNPALTSPVSPPSVAATTTTTVTSSAGAQTPRPKELLNYLSNLLKFNVQYTDFPKVNQSQFLSLVSLSINPPQVFHGAGPTIDASHDQAARIALQVFSENGLDTVNPAITEAVMQGNLEDDGKLHVMKSGAAVTSNGSK